MEKNYNLDVSKLSDMQYEYVVCKLEKELKRVNEENNNLYQEIINKIDYIKQLQELTNND